MASPGAVKTLFLRASKRTGTATRRPRKSAILLRRSEALDEDIPGMHAQRQFFCQLCEVPMIDGHDKGAETHPDCGDEPIEQRRRW